MGEKPKRGFHQMAVNINGQPAGATNLKNLPSKKKNHIAAYGKGGLRKKK